MFKKSNKQPQLDAFANVTAMLDGVANKQYNDGGHWHNQFREQIVMRIDESIYSVLYSESMGAPNASICTLIGMMILKESFGWSDSQLFEHCRFNLLVRSAIGLFNMNDSIPSESTYYLLRKRIYEYQRQSGEDLIANTFSNITRGQVREFEVNGRSIRMDSKLIGSNIAFFGRYELIHQTLCMFYKSLDKVAKSRIHATDMEQLQALCNEETGKTVYRSSREEITSRLQPIGILTYKMLKLFDGIKTQPFELLWRVFNEQYQITEDLRVELRPKEEISSSSVQSPHDPDSAYRNKAGEQVKGYSVNITESNSEGNLNLITNVIVDKANTPDKEFVEPAIVATTQVTGQKVEKVYADGAYQSPDNDAFCENIDMVFTGVQGAKSRFDLQITDQGLLVTDTQTSECQIAKLATKNKNSKEDRYFIISDHKKIYFGQSAIRAAMIRKTINQRSIKELHKRNNVEATIFQLAYHLRNKKSKYRTLIKQQIWATCRCLWINFVRILNYIKQTYQGTHICWQKSKKWGCFIPKTFTFLKHFPIPLAFLFLIIFFPKNIEIVTIRKCHF
ncbi:MAG TPA: transposase [Bacteroidales bacterium]|nr:transposase [Bacteroidales bacterium]